jgi:hypothetical protein
MTIATMLEVAGISFAGRTPKRVTAIIPRTPSAIIPSTHSAKLTADNQAERAASIRNCKSQK